ncbi:hypothetical protein D3C73_1014700 [compost metagenome]
MLNQHLFQDEVERHEVVQLDDVKVLYVDVYMHTSPHRIIYNRVILVVLYREVLERNTSVLEAHRPVKNILNVFRPTQRTVMLILPVLIQLRKASALYFNLDADITIGLILTREIEPLHNCFHTIATPSKPLSDIGTYWTIQQHHCPQYQQDGYHLCARPDPRYPQPSDGAMQWTSTSSQHRDTLQRLGSHP